jgi:hypothetical protein
MTQWRKEPLMRVISLFGATAIALTLGAVAARADNPNVPRWSPYAIMGYDQSMSVNSGDTMTEGRAADVATSPNGAGGPPNYARIHHRPVAQNPDNMQ